MWRRRAYVLFSALVVLILTGCTGLVSTSPEETSGPQVLVSIAEDNRTVLFDASDYLNYQPSGLRFYWDFEGKGYFEESDPVVVYKYPAPGIYYCRLKVEGWTGPSSGSSGSGGGQGAPGGIGSGSSSSGSDVKKYRSFKVDLLQKGYPIPIIKIWDAWTDEVDPEKIRALHKLVFDASASYSPDGDKNLWYRWEFVYVEEENGEWVPKPYPWPNCIVCPKEPEFLRFQGPQVEFKYGLPSPSCWNFSSPWVYRVRLWVTDSYGRTSFKEMLVKVCPC